MFDDEDFGFLTGGLGDLDGDGRVDFSEYIIEEATFQSIMGTGNDDYSVLEDDDLEDDIGDSEYEIDDMDEDSDIDDDWKTTYTDTAMEYGLDPDDFSDQEELLEAQSNNDDNAAYLSNGFYSDSTDYDEDDEDDELDDTDGDTIPFADFDISKLTLTIGAHTSLDYNGKPIDQVFGNPEDKKAQSPKKNAAFEKKIHEKSYKELKNENKALKSKITKLEKTIADLNHVIQRLEADLAAKRKVKEWDGKYYRYCKVVMDESPNGLWYRTDDITLKNGDYVYVPFGYQNVERMAKVVSVEEFRSDDLPFPLERTKFICYKCDE